jgi:hypothetical protein
MTDSRRLCFSRRTAWGWVIAILAVVVVGAIVALVTQTGAARFFAPAVAVVLIAVVLLATLRGPSRLEGTVLVQRGTLRTHRADLAQAADVSLRPVAGAAQLVVRDTAGRQAFETVLLLSQYVKHAQPPELLDAIGAALASAPAPSAAGVRKVLGLQASHLRAGGSPETSPLRVMTHRALLHSPEGLELRRTLESPD